MERQQEVNKGCVFCQEKVFQVDYKDVNSMKKSISPYGRILGKERMGLCARHQRQLATAVKRARHLALLPFTL